MNIQIENKADLHIHSTHSDGSWSVKQLISAYAKLNFKAISITDHDNLDAFTEGHLYAKEKGLELILGVEISTYEQGRAIHILGYYVDSQNQKLKDVLKTLQESRSTLMKEMVSELQKIGLDIPLNLVLEEAQGSSLGRPHLAKVLVKLNYVKNTTEAFEKYLTQPVILNIPRYRLTPEEGIKLIHQAGGVAVLAHPHRNNTDEIIPRLADFGLDGIEVFIKAGRNTKAVRKKYKKLADKLGLLYSGGSDFHGNYGSFVGEVELPYECVEKLKAKAS